MRVPVSTYRLQVHADFTLEAAAAVIPYLHALGITDLYLSPVFDATPGSTHGYDVTDPTRIGRALGGRDAFDRLAARAQEHGMGVLLDIVPNHMSASEHSPWWQDVLRRGRDSEFAGFFDIDWGTEEQPRRLLLPVLGGTLEEVLERGELKLERAAGDEWVIEYFGRRLPVATERCGRAQLEACAAADPARQRDLLRHLLEQQHYELVNWTVAGQKLGYRRFFDITDLAGVRVERDDVFERTHSLILELLRAGLVTGLRIDHVDGLRDPAGYLERLRSHGDTYLVVEKILERDEPLPPWPVQGTTGYDFLNILNGVFVHPAGHEYLTAAYRRLTGAADAFEDVVYRKKKLVMERLFGGERAALALLLRPLLGDVASDDDALRAVTELTAAMPVYRTYTRSFQVLAADRAALDHAFAELARRAPDLPAAIRQRLRTILLLEDEQVREQCLEFVLRWQQFSGPVMAKGFEDTALYVYTPFIAANEVGGSPPAAAVSVPEFHRRMQARARDWPHALSATATHDTKRGEDTRARIDVLSEVAEDWTRRFRAWMQRAEDHKEAAAEEAGLDENAPVPNAKEESLLYQTLVGAWPTVGEHDEEFIERIKQYMHKAVREGKETTSWRRPDEDYETALAAFVENLLVEFRARALHVEIAEYAGRTAWYGALNSLAQLLVKITCPGVPDFYQGTELWALTLVDPDNRRPVDYGDRRARLAALEPLLANPSPADVRALLREWRTGEIKLYLTAAALRFRRGRADLFARGEYLPLEVVGARADHVLAFARVRGSDVAITVVPRLTAALGAPEQLPSADAWQDTSVLLPDTLPGTTLRNVLTGEDVEADGRLSVAGLLRDCPVALLGSR